jgi:transposase
MSRIGKLRKRLISNRHACVVITSEYNTSKLCCNCYSPVRLAKAHRERRDGQPGNRLVELHGAVQCTNRLCPLSKITMPRDLNASTELFSFSFD